MCSDEDEGCVDIQEALKINKEGVIKKYSVECPTKDRNGNPLKAVCSKKSKKRECSIDNQ